MEELGFLMSFDVALLFVELIKVHWQLFDSFDDEMWVVLREKGN
jgi:hypothetical protein